MQWFRLYTSTLNHPKAQKLSGDIFKHWVNILCIAAENEGVLPTADDLAFAMRASVTEMLHVTKTLLEADLLAVTKNQYGETLSPKNWREKQYKSDSSAERVKRHREKNKTVTVTPPEQSRADTEQIQKEEDNTALSARAPEADSLKYYYKKIHEEGMQLFPKLATRRSAEISKWLEAGADADLDILPELRRAAGKDIGSWSYFSGAIMDSFSNRLKPLPKGNENGLSIHQQPRNAPRNQTGNKSDRALASARSAIEE